MVEFGERREEFLVAPEGVFGVEIGKGFVVDLGTGG